MLSASICINVILAFTIWPLCPTLQWGAISTGTHGAGVFNGNLASHVVQVKVVTGDALVRTYRVGQDPEFKHIPVSFGLTGVIVEIELDIVQDYDIQQCIYEDLPLNTIDKSDYKTAFSSAYSFSMFTQYKNRRFTSIWAKYKLAKGKNGDEESTLIDCPSMNKRKPSTRKVHPLPGGNTEHVSGGIGANYKEPGFVGLPHFLMDSMPSHGEELQSEYFVANFISKMFCWNYSSILKTTLICMTFCTLANFALLIAIN